MADLKTPPQFAGECIGVSLTNRGANDSHKIVSLFIEDDGNWHPKAAFSQHWLAEAIRVLQDAQAAIAGRATPAPGAPGQEAAFPPRILALLREVADRNGTATHGPFEDGNGEPLQDDADAAIAWIAAQEAAAVQAVGAWQDIATAPASSETVLVVTQLGTVRTETGHYVRNMASAAAANGEQCNFRGWMPAPLPPAALPAGAGEKTS